MHHACRFVIRVAESNGITTVPKSRPPGLTILYASRTSVFILSADCTVTIRSEYISTASVLSSCAGTLALARACIHAGASAAARDGQANVDTLRTATHKQTLPSVAGLRSNWLQNDLFFIARPHDLVKVSQRRIILRVDHQQIASQHSRKMQRSLVALHFSNVQHNFPILRQLFWQAANLPGQWQLYRHVIRFLERIVEIHRVHTVRVIEKLFLGRAE